MINPDGKVAGVYRKSHIPDGPGYEEKFYFRPGNTGFKVWPGAGTTLGVGICWDQWYPETARAMMLMGAQILFYPTAIGTEPHDPDLDTSRLWRRAMIGHAVSNVVPVVAANRIGTEGGQRFYGHSFICDERGDILAEFGAEESGVLVAELDLAAAKTASRGVRLLPRPQAGALRAAGPGRLRLALLKLQCAFEHRLRTSPHRADAYSGCSGCNDSLRAGYGRPRPHALPRGRIWSSKALGRAPALPRHGQSGPER